MINKFPGRDSKPVEGQVLESESSKKLFIQ